jgi:hypothetical protein
LLLHRITIEKAKRWEWEAIRQLLVEEKEEEETIGFVSL